MTNDSIVATIKSSPVRVLTGDVAMWFFVLIELTVFAILFICFAVARAFNQPLFVEGQAQLHPTLGLINTLALIFSSFWLALAINYYRQHQVRSTQITLVLSILCAVVYMVVKYHEYQLLWQAGFSVTTNTFFTLYFFITLFHYLHVIAGVLLIIYLFTKATTATTHSNLFESIGVYWHAVDIIWIILFPILYVISQ